MGKITVTAACGLIAFGLSDLKYYTDPVNHPDSYLSSPLMPVLISVLAGYTISNLFLQVSLAPCHGYNALPDLPSICLPKSSACSASLAVGWCTYVAGP